MKLIDEDAIKPYLLDGRYHVEPLKYGRWITHDLSIKNVPIEACSLCGTWSYGHNENYCPECGATMSEGWTNETNQERQTETL